MFTSLKNVCIDNYKFFLFVPRHLIEDDRMIAISTEHAGMTNS